MNKILVLAGDGIGPEIIGAALKVLEHTAKKYNFKYELDIKEFGGAAIDKYGLAFPDPVRESLKTADAILMGAIGGAVAGSKWDKARQRPEEGLLELRKELQIYANVRPLKVNEKLAFLSPLKEEVVKGTDLLIIRELISGIYFGKPRYLREDEALDSMTYTRHEIERIVRYGFEVAKKRRKKLTSVDKANVLATSKLWRRVVEEVAKDYPDVDLDHQYVDAMAMELITRPSSFDVIVTSNIFGDILSDEASVLAGSLGLLSSASFSLDGPALYEPAHGSAPDIAGQGIANPIATLYSMTMMLSHSFKEYEMAKQINQAIDKTLNSGYFTKDLNKQNYLKTGDWVNKLIDNID